MYVRIKSRILEGYFTGIWIRKQREAKNCRKKDKHVERTVEGNVQNTSVWLTHSAILKNVRDHFWDFQYGSEAGQVAPSEDF